MVQPQNRPNESNPDVEEVPSVHRLPSLPQNLRRVYDELVDVGATGPASARPVEYLSRELHHPKKEMEHELHVLEGKGVVAHVTSGNETAWYARR